MRELLIVRINPYVYVCGDVAVVFPDPNFPNIWKKLYPIQNGGKERIFFKYINPYAYMPDALKFNCTKIVYAYVSTDR